MEKKIKTNPQDTKTSWLGSFGKFFVEGAKLSVDPDPDDVSIENAYKTRWVWYHTMLGILILTTNILLVAILIVLAVKL
jgi:hypothetical protein